MRTVTSSRLQSDINVTPLVDVCLVLLIIFMVVTPMIVNGPVRLPATHHGSPEDPAKRQISIAVHQDGTLSVDAVAIRTEQLQSELERLHAKHTALPVTVRGDKSVRYGEVVDVLDAARAAGFHEVGLVTQRKDPR